MPGTAAMLSRNPSRLRASLVYTYISICTSRLLRRDGHVGNLHNHMICPDQEIPTRARRRKTAPSSGHQVSLSAPTVFMRGTCVSARLICEIYTIGAETTPTTNHLDTLATRRLRGTAVTRYTHIKDQARLFPPEHERQRRKVIRRRRYQGPNRSN